MYKIAALYVFVTVDDPETLREHLEARARHHGVTGILLVAGEGLNGTIAAGENALDAFLDELRSDTRFKALELKFSQTDKAPFRRLRVRLKKEIVTLGVDGIDPARHRGTYVDPEDWNALISDPDVVVVDTRNNYETMLGTFKGAIDPNTETFRDFPDWVEANRERLEGAKKIAMFCTGGIRCEKSTAFMKSKGFDEVYHLKGGILQYLEDVQETASMWDGECFVFDERVSVTHGLEAAGRAVCRACRQPLVDGAKDSEFYEEGASCPLCFHKTTDAQKDRFRERHRQMLLARAGGVTHLGPRAKA